MARFSWLIGTAAVCGLMLPMAAQAQYYNGDYRYGQRHYNSACDQVKGERQAAGAVIGGLLGAAIGNGVAADNTREEGTALGAVLGAAIGAGIGNDSADCKDFDQHGYYRDDSWRQVSEPYGKDYRYGNDGLRGGPYTHPQRDWRHDRYGYGQQGYGKGYGRHHRHGDRHNPYRVYDDHDRVAARQCETVWRTVYLPDGREVREPVRACREAEYGDWHLQGR